MNFEKENIPNILTISRILLVPVLMVSFYLEEGYKGYTVFIFFIASVTDYLDGYLSRKWNVTSNLGTFLDPIADKLIVVCALALLIDVDNVHIVPAVGIMCREIFISGLREFLANSDIKLPVTKASKWKTGTQMLAIILLLLEPTHEYSFSNALFIFGSGALWIAFFLTFYTGYLYFKAARDGKHI